MESTTLLSGMDFSATFEAHSPTKQRDWELKHWERGRYDSNVIERSLNGVFYNTRAFTIAILEKIPPLIECKMTSEVTAVL